MNGHGHRDGALPAALTGWHLDKKVPLGIIATIIIQSGALVWYTAKIDARVELNERLTADWISEFRQHAMAQSHSGSAIESARQSATTSLMLTRQEQILAELRELNGRVSRLEGSNGE